jgi:hypothetical protein
MARKEQGMSDLRTAAQQALEALEELNGWQSLAPPLASQAGRQAAINLRAALTQPTRAQKINDAGYTRRPTLREMAEPVQEPVTNNPDPYHLSRILHELAGSASMCWEHVDRAGVFQSTQAADVVAAAIAEIRQRMKDAPPSRKPLSDEELDRLWREPMSADWEHREFARAVEAALRSKNHE